MKEKTREEEETGQKMEDKRRSERRHEEREETGPSNNFEFFKKITITGPESILIFPVTSLVHHWFQKVKKSRKLC